MEKEAKQEFCSKYSLNPSDSYYMVEFRGRGWRCFWKAAEGLRDGGSTAKGLSGKGTGRLSWT